MIITPILKSCEDVAVGQSGYTNLLHLSTLCDSIGMDGLDNELELLFLELDINGDDLVGFNKFLNGLFVIKNNTNSNRSPILLRSQSFFSPLIPSKTNDNGSHKRFKNKLPMLPKSNLEAILRTSLSLGKKDENLFL